MAVSLDEGPAAAVREWTKERDAEFPVLHDSGGKAAGEPYGVEYLPTHVLIDREGKVVKRSTEAEPLTLEEMGETVPKLLGAN